MTGFLLLMAIGLALYGAFLIASTWITLQYPPRRTYAWAVSRRLPGEPDELTPALGFRRFEFASRAGQLIAWDIDGLNPDGPVMVLTHGWSDSKVGALSRVQALAPMCSRLIAWDLPGHGESAGLCELGLRESEDLLRLIESIGVKGTTPILLFGWSLGAGVSIVAGATKSVAGVIAEAPYRVAATPAMNVMRARGSPWRINLPAALWLVRMRSGVPETEWRGFDRAERVKFLRLPVLVLHGSSDVVCPPEDARAIAGAAPDATLVEIPGARHNDMWTNARNCGAATQAVGEFVTRLIREKAQATGVGRES